MGTQNKSDEELVKMAKTGDKGAFGMLYERYKNRVYGFAYRMLGTRAEAEEAVSETFISIFTKISGFDDSKVFSYWLFRITRNKCLDIMRKRRNFVSFSVFSNKDTGPSIEENIASSEDIPSDSVEKSENAQLIKQAIVELPVEQKTAIILREYEGLSYKEIAIVMDCSLEKVKILLFRARESLSKKLLPILKEMES